MSNEKTQVNSVEEAFPRLKSFLRFLLKKDKKLLESIIGVNLSSSGTKSMTTKDFDKYLDTVDFVGIKINFDKLSKNNFFRVFDNLSSRSLINFEGVDATGKATQSKLLKGFFEEIALHKDFVSHISIPDYETPHGKLIINYLNGEDSLFNSSDIYCREQIVSNARIYGINRSEAFYGVTAGKNIIEKFTQGQNLDLGDSQSYLSENTNYDNKSIIVLDRWTDSAVAFSLAKLLSYFPDQKDDLGQLADYINYFEYNTLGLPVPKVTVICKAPIDEIERRIRVRRGEEERPADNDIHEKNLDLLKCTQEIYESDFVAEFANTKIILDSGYDRGIDELQNELIYALCTLEHSSHTISI